MSRINNLSAANTSCFHSLPVTAGAYELTARLEPVYHTGSSAAASAGSCAVAVQDIELIITNRYYNRKYYDWVGNDSNVFSQCRVLSRQDRKK